MSPKERKLADKLTKIFGEIYELMRTEEDEPRSNIDLKKLDAKVADATAALSDLLTAENDGVPSPRLLKQKPMARVKRKK